MIRLISDQSSIEKDGETSWCLSLVFSLQGVHSRTRVNVALDKNMIPFPPEIQTSEGLSISASMFSASASYSNETVDIDKRTVSFVVTIPHFSKAMEYLRKKIAFRWSLKCVVPDTVKFTVQVGKKRYYVDGINTDNSFLELLKRRKESIFYFPSTVSLYEIPLDEIYGTCTSLYDSQPGAAWAVTWPDEEQFWHSSAGYKFLICQVRKMIMSGGVHQPRRVAVCPFSIECPPAKTRRFLNAMEIQDSLGFEVRVAEPALLKAAFGRENAAITLYGNSASFLSKHIDDLRKNTSVYAALTKNDVDEARRLYKDVFGPAKSWAEYKRYHQIKFEHREQEHILRVVARVKELAVKSKMKS